MSGETVQSKCALLTYSTKLPDVRPHQWGKNNRECQTKTKTDRARDRERTNTKGNIKKERERTKLQTERKIARLTKRLRSEIVNGTDRTRKDTQGTERKRERERDRGRVREKEREGNQNRIQKDSNLWIN